LAAELAALPGHPFTVYRDDTLFVEDVSVSGLAEAHGTPLFVYSKAAMLSALAAYQRGFAGRDAQICYAMKANSSLGVLQVFTRPVAASTLSRAVNWNACLPSAATFAKSSFQALAKRARK